MTIKAGGCAVITSGSSVSFCGSSVVVDGAATSVVDGLSVASGTEGFSVGCSGCSVDGSTEDNVDSPPSVSSGFCDDDELLDALVVSGSDSVTEETDEDSETISVTEGSSVVVVVSTATGTEAASVVLLLDCSEEEISVTTSSGLSVETTTSGSSEEMIRGGNSDAPDVGPDPDPISSPSSGFSVGFSSSSGWLVVTEVEGVLVDDAVVTSSVTTEELDVVLDAASVGNSSGAAEEGATVAVAHS